MPNSNHGRSDVNPAEPKPEKGECELRKPQPQATLPRILDPMPFPKGLLETLAHTAAFVDQAGYLAKYALDVCFPARECFIRHMLKVTALFRPGCRLPRPTRKGQGQGGRDYQPQEDC